MKRPCAHWKIYFINLLVFSLPLYYFLFVQSDQDRQQSQPIENVYPYFHGNKSGIMVHKEKFWSIYGYAVDPFKYPNQNRNHFHPRKRDEKIDFLIIHYTDTLDFEYTVKHFTLNNTSNGVSSHYVIAKPVEAGAHKQLLQVNIHVVDLWIGLTK